MVYSSSSDFLSNLVVLLIRLRNAGIDDGGLLMHLSEATAGSLSGVGHSTAYLDPGGYESVNNTRDVIPISDKYQGLPFAISLRQAMLSERSPPSKLRRLLRRRLGMTTRYVGAA